MSGLHVSSKKSNQSQLDILVADSDSESLSMLKGYCQEMDSFRNIVLATDGSMCMRKISNQEFFLILLDLDLERKTGMDIIRDCKKFRPEILSKIILMAKEIDKMTFDLAFNNGIKHFLVKPFTKEMFSKRVDQFFRSHSK